MDPIDDLPPTSDVTPTTGDRRQVEHFVMGLASITLAGLLARVIFAVSRAHTTLGGDAYFYFWQAKEVATGKGFIAPLAILEGFTASATHPPGFVIVLAGLRLIGLDTPQSARYAMCLLGSATIVVAALLVRKLLGRRAGLIVAFLVAFYPPIWINDGMLMSETLFLFAFALTLWFGYAVLDRPTVRNVAGLSIAIAVAMSTRPESALLYVFIALPVIVTRGDVAWRRRIGLLGLAAIIPVIAFAPWFLYNKTRFAEPVYLSTGFGQTLLQANCNATYYGRGMGYYSFQCLDVAKGAPRRALDGSVNDAIMRRAAFKYMKAHAKHLPKVVAAREARTWGLYKVHKTVWYEARTERGIGTPLAWTEMWSYWAMALLALPGFFIWRAKKVPTFPLIAQIVATGLVTGITFGLTRYRVGADLCLIMFAAATIGWVTQRVTSRLRRSVT